MDLALQRELRDVAHALADVARPITLRAFRAPQQTDNKAGPGAFDPVTKADRDAESAMRDLLGQRRPDDAILGEEFPAKPGTTGITWVLDPIDGTRGYISGTPTWGVLISASMEDGPVFGIIDQPYIGERFEGGWGAARCDGPRGLKALKTSQIRNLEQATILTTFPEVGSRVERAAFHALAKHTQLTRYGMDCYGYALLAAGQVELVVEAGLNAYDIHAPIAVVEAAGGVVTSWTGGPAHPGGRVLAAANTDIHAAALAQLRGRPDA